MKRLSIYILILFFFSTVINAKMEFASPKPSFDNPRKWVVPINSDDIHKVNHIIGAINNVINEYPPEGINVVIVFYSSGMRVIKRDYDKNTQKRLLSLVDGYDVELIGCLNTMKTMKWTEKDFIDGVIYRKAGVAEVIERDSSGWFVFAPY
jgi:intracellular sulfur oxidation DsrE/DsrF family protein